MIKGCRTKLSFPMELVLVFQSLMLLCLCFPLTSCLTPTNVAPFSKPICHDYERSSLLQFKGSIHVEDGHSKLESWNLHADCCSWDGVECDNNTGHVSGLDLSSSFLQGSINSSSSLFHLLHIRRLNLSDNFFNYSEIPHGIKNLSRLANLDLSSSGFVGQIPSEVLELPMLVSLVLSGNQLWLRSPSLDDLVMKGTNLTELQLDGVNISSTVPPAMASLSNLTSLSMEDCGLLGKFPTQIFQLPKLRILRLRDNPFLTGSLPEFEKSSSLEVLELGSTSFSGKLPKSMHALKSLTYMDIGNCLFSGFIPFSIGELTKLSHMLLFLNKFSGQIPSSFAKLTELTVLDLSLNNFSRGTLSWLGNQTKLEMLLLNQANLHGEIPSSLGYLTQLTSLDLGDNQLNGQFPPLLQNLTNLSSLNLDGNQLTGQLPPWIGNLTKLTTVGIGQNRFDGPIPESIFNLGNLEVLSLHRNFFTGTLEFQSFLKLKSLTVLQLNHNDLKLHTTISSNVTSIQKFIILGLSYCDISEFPDFLRGQDQLEILGLAGNQIQGQIPRWMFDVGKESLTFLGLKNNFLTGFEQAPAVLPWTNLEILDLDSNKFQSSIPSPPRSIFAYYVADNPLTGDISPLICNLSSIEIIDMSGNNFSGEIPQCLTQLSATLLVLNLRNNSFSGHIPQLCSKGSPMKIIDMSQNQLQGQIPRSLAECTMLETLNLANNRITDVFPSWLGTIAGLRVLILGHNNFHGAIRKPEDSKKFQGLRIIDLSFNSFQGNLPSDQFKNWNAMKAVDSGNLSYLQVLTQKQVSTRTWTDQFLFTVSMADKGRQTYFSAVQDFLVVIDFSSNKFEGQVPEELWGLKSLIWLNLSNNLLSGEIPAAIADLPNLESLDLSRNGFSGGIPPELAQLTFLEFLNLSDNHLSGPIPGGKQLATFENNSFAGNPELCGTPLSKRCEAVNSSGAKEDGSGSESLFEWTAILVGYGTGLVIGIGLGYAFNRREHQWLEGAVARITKTPYSNSKSRR